MASAVERVEVAADGIPGDRCLAVVDERGIVTGRRKQRMIGLPAALDGRGEPLVDGHPWDSRESAAAISEVAGLAAKLTRPPGGHEHDAAQILLLTDGSVAQLGYDRRRFRPNIYVEGAAGPMELGWIGREVRVGDLVLRVDEPCDALRDHDHRPGHDRGRPRCAQADPPRARRADGRLLHRRGTRLGRA